MSATALDWLRHNRVLRLPLPVRQSFTATAAESMVSAFDRGCELRVTFIAWVPSRDAVTLEFEHERTRATRDVDTMVLRQSVSKVDWLALADQAFNGGDE